MSSHLSRKDLKKDPLVAAELGAAHYVGEHKSQVTRIAATVLVALVALGGYWIYSNRQATARQEALREARRAVTGVVGTATPPTLSFASKEEQDKAIQERFGKLAEQYPGTTEGSIARMYLAAKALDLADSDKAVTYYREVIADAPEEFESSAKLALAQVLWGQGKTDEGKKLLEDLIANPTAFVSADQASLTLARLELKTDPEDARKRLEQLKSGSTTISMLAVEMMVQLPPKPAN